MPPPVAVDRDLDLRQRDSRTLEHRRRLLLGQAKQDREVANAFPVGDTDGGRGVPQPGLDRLDQGADPRLGALRGPVGVGPEVAVHVAGRDGTEDRTPQVDRRVGSIGDPRLHRGTLRVRAGRSPVHHGRQHLRVGRALVGRDHEPSVDALLLELRREAIPDLEDLARVPQAAREDLAGQEQPPVPTDDDIGVARAAERAVVDQGARDDGRSPKREGVVDGLVDRAGRTAGPPAPGPTPAGGWPRSGSR